MRDSVQRVVDDAAGPDNQMLYLFGGVALAIFGVGLILSNRSVRQLLGEIKPGALVQAAVPDLQRYLKLRAM